MLSARLHPITCSAPSYWFITFPCAGLVIIPGWRLWHPQLFLRWPVQPQHERKPESRPESKVCESVWSMWLHMDCFYPFPTCFLQTEKLLLKRLNSRHRSSWRWNIWGVGGLCLVLCHFLLLSPSGSPPPAESLTEQHWLKPPRSHVPLCWISAAQLCRNDSASLWQTQTVRSFHLTAVWTEATLQSCSETCWQAAAANKPITPVSYGFWSHFHHPKDNHLEKLVSASAILCSFEVLQFSLIL